jgi:gliding motility-associated-like protein
MKRKLTIVLFILSKCCIPAWAQYCPPTPYLDFKDSQFEHTPVNSNIGSDWISCGGDPSDQWGTADIQPIKPPTGVQIGVDVPPKAGNGKTYLGFFACWDRNKPAEKNYNWQEIIYQKLGKPMKAGTTYRLSIDVMVPETRYEYDEWPGGTKFTQYTCTPAHTILRRQTKPGAITIRGSNAAGSCRGSSTILWRSPTVANDSKWVTFEFTITPTKDYDYIAIAPEIPDEVTSAGEIRDYICIDNIHPILPDSIKTSVTHLTCPNSNNGTGKVILSPNVNLPVDITWSNGSKTADIKDLKPGKYYVVVKDSKGFIMCDSVIVKDASPYTIDSTVVNVSCFGGNDGSATVHTTAKPPATYSWNPGGQTGATATNLTAGTYTCTVKDSAGCPQTKVVTVKEPTKIIATATHTDVTVPKGSDGTATVVNPTGGTPPYTYLWDDSNKQTTQTAVNLKAGTYTCTITDKNGCKTTVTVIIIEPPLFIVKIDTIHVTCFNGNDGKIVLHPSKGTAPYTFSWTPNVSSDSVGNNLKAGVYTIDVKDANDIVVTITATIRQPDELTADITGKNITCNGAKNGEAAVVNVKGGTLPYTYEWSPGGATTDKLINLAAGTYSCTVTDSHGCKITKSVTITEPEPLVMSHVLTNISCFGYTDGKAIISVNGGIKPYLYFLDTVVSAQTDSVFNTLKAGTYTYHVLDKNRCISTGSFVLTEPPSPVISTVTTPTTCNLGNDGTIELTIRAGTEPITYNWVPGNITTANLSNQPAGTYVCTIIYNGGACTTTSEAIITQPDPVLVKADPVTICYGSSAILTAHDAAGGNGAPYTYEWATPAFSGNPYTVDPLITTSYTLIATDAKGCKSAPVNVTVTVKEKLKVIALKPQLICAGSSAELNADASGGSGNYSYQWLPAGTGATATVHVSPATTTVYTVTLSDDCGTPPVSDTVRITVIPKPIADFNADIRMGCPVLCVKYTSSYTAVGDVIKQWTWDFGDGTMSHEANPSHCYSKTGLYTVSLSIKTANGCENKITKPDYIEVYPVPVADFRYSPDRPTLIEPTVQFTDQSSLAVKWSWDFGDFDLNHNTSLLQHPSHTYSDTGRYCIKLAVETDKGCPAKTEKCLYVIPDVTIYVPNAFTPGVRDGKNDYFFAKGTYIKTFKMWIFDRWGMLIFSSNDINEGWLGDVKGSGVIAQQDVYVWKITATDYLNKKHELIGTVTLVQ